MKDCIYSPVALFVYDRLEHTQQTINALLANLGASETDLYIFSDLEANEKAKSRVCEVRAYIKTVKGFKSVNIFERAFNYGLASSIIDGVSYVINKHERVIVLEDDLVTSPYFLKFMNDGLNLYRDDTQVASIHGYNYPIVGGMPETFFLKGADCWGWATWKRAWSVFQPDGKVLLSQILRKNLQNNFDFNGSYPFTKMLENQISGKVNSWAIRWYASAFLKDMLTLYPGKSLVHNIGMDGSGTHCSANFSFGDTIYMRPVNVERIPLQQNPYVFSRVSAFHREQRKFRRLKFICNSVLQLINKVRSAL